MLSCGDHSRYHGCREREVGEVVEIDVEETEDEVGYVARGAVDANPEPDGEAVCVTVGVGVGVAHRSQSPTHLPHATAAAATPMAHAGG